jgi:hypothetical protein
MSAQQTVTSNAETHTEDFIGHFLDKNKMKMSFNEMLFDAYVSSKMFFESEKHGNVTLLVTVHKYGFSLLGTWKVCFCCSMGVKFLFFKQAAHVQFTHTGMFWYYFAINT